MSLCRLPACHVDLLFACLGPDYSSLRAASVFARDRSNHIDLSFEILRWHCVNSTLLCDKLHCFEGLGRMPIRCSVCQSRSKQRQRYRYTPRTPRLGSTEGILYLCSHCVLKETRVFLTSVEDCLVAQGSNGRSRERSDLLLGIMCRIAPHRGGFVSDCLSVLRRH